MNNLMNCWDKCVSLVNPLATEDIAEGKEILIEDSFTEFFDFCNHEHVQCNDDKKDKYVVLVQIPSKYLYFFDFFQLFLLNSLEFLTN